MIKVFDFFSGCGGTSLGFHQNGFKLIGALDYDSDAAETYKSNFPDVKFWNSDIRNVETKELSDVMKKSDELLFCGCAPCQPFSSHQRNTGYDSRRNLLLEFIRFIRYWSPNHIFLENVPGIQNINKSKGVFKKFLDNLDDMGYSFDMGIVKANELGIPQNRKRFILVASKKIDCFESLEKILVKHNCETKTVRDSISSLPAISAGETHSKIKNHSAAKLSPLNLQRIKATPHGGDRRDWPNYLKSKSQSNHSGHTDVYGRMNWDKPASTLTTKCTSYSNGRYGHPIQDRAISAREAARLQSFPDDFFFKGSLSSCSRQIGNAVPPLMAKNISDCFVA